MGSLLQRNRVMALSHLQYYLRDKGVRPERRSSKVCGNEQRPYAPLRDSLRVPAETLLPSDTTQHPGTTMANEPSTDLPTAREAASSSEACQEKEQAPSQAPEEEPVETREATQDPVREGPPLARMGLTKRDVLLGRGKGTTQHDGNVRYLKIIDEFAPIYQKLSTRQDQLAVKVDVVKAVHEYGGRFMQHVDGSKTEFCEAPMQVIMKKIGQVSRGAPEPREDVVGTLVALHPHPCFYSAVTTPLHSQRIASTAPGKTQENVRRISQGGRLSQPSNGYFQTRHPPRPSLTIVRQSRTARTAILAARHPTHRTTGSPSTPTSPSATTTPGHCVPVGPSHGTQRGEFEKSQLFRGVGLNTSPAATGTKARTIWLERILRL